MNDIYMPLVHYEKKAPGGMFDQEKEITIMLSFLNCKLVSYEKNSKFVYPLQKYLSLVKEYKNDSNLVLLESLNNEKELKFGVKKENLLFVFKWDYVEGKTSWMSELWIDYTKFK